MTLAHKFRNLSNFRMLSVHHVAANLRFSILPLVPLFFPQWHSIVLLRLLPGHLPLFLFPLLLSLLLHIILIKLQSLQLPRVPFLLFLCLQRIAHLLPLPLTLTILNLTLLLPLYLFLLHRAIRTMSQRVIPRIHLRIPLLLILPLLPLTILLMLILLPMEPTIPLLPLLLTRLPHILRILLMALLLGVRQAILLLTMPTINNNSHSNNIQSPLRLLLLRLLQRPLERFCPRLQAVMMLLITINSSKHRLSLINNNNNILL